ncbi:MAG: hypothetical protein U1E37_00430 [Sphingomonadaceae bacterium]
MALVGLSFATRRQAAVQPGFIHFRSPRAVNQERSRFKNFADRAENGRGSYTFKSD